MDQVLRFAGVVLAAVLVAVLLHTGIGFCV
ncbi:hypothetical protein EDD78_103203 [Harryflintia acetispora]|uniref:Uncharacterized protein n=1 Tax=Harryflintia acetispora TaxID=1849041 RepID=A0A9X8UKN5_9FIRM|nr:hypothetical protein EDD78_103203 [Harryflintia acetispora]